MRIVLLACTTLLLSGCSSAPTLPSLRERPAADEPARKLLDAQACCLSYREMRYARLEPGKEALARIGVDSPVFDFPSGRSFFAAFELPSGGSRKLFLKTYLANEREPRAGRVLVPEVRLLDAQHRQIASLAPRFETHIPKYTGPWWAEAELALPDGARFLVVLDGHFATGLTWRDYGHNPVFVSSGPTGEVGVRCSF